MAPAPLTSVRRRETALTRLERDLLTCLTAEPVRVWSYAELHHAVWHDPDIGPWLPYRVSAGCAVLLIVFFCWQRSV